MQTNHSIKVNKYKILLIILIFFILISNFIWLKIYTLPPQGNGLNDLMPAINFYLSIIQTKVSYSYFLNVFKSFSAIKAFLFDVCRYLREHFFIYPPLAPVSYTLFYLVFGPYTKMELMVNSIYIATALCAIYGIGKKMLNEKAGLLAAFVFSSFMGVIILGRCAYGELFSMSLVSLTLYLLLKTDYLQNWKYSILMGIALGLTALSKWDFPPALIGPFLVVLWKIYSKAKWEGNEEYYLSRATAKKNLFIAILIGILISAFWYISCLNTIMIRFKNIDDQIVAYNKWRSQDGFVSIIQALTYYLFTIINVLIGFFYFVILILIGIAAFIYKIVKRNSLCFLSKNQLFYFYFLISWIVIPYVSFTLTKIFVPSHIVLILPALAIIVSIGITTFKNRFVRIVLTSLIVAFGLFMYSHSFFYLDKLEPFYNLRVDLSSDGKVTFTTNRRMEWEESFLYPPDRRDWRIKDIMSFIKEDSRTIGHKPIVLILNRTSRNYRDFQYYNLLWKYKMYILPIGHDCSERPCNIFSFDYVIFMNHDGNVNEYFARSAITSVLNGDGHFYTFDKWDEFISDFFQKNKYQLIKVYFLPDNIITKIYKLTVG